MINLKDKVQIKEIKRYLFKKIKEQSRSTSLYSNAVAVVLTTYRRLARRYFNCLEVPKIFRLQYVK